MADTDTDTPLPLVDISPYLLHDFAYPPAHSQLACSEAIHAACIEFGFFYVSGLGIDDSDLEGILDLSRAFFSLPTPIKARLSIVSAHNGTDGARGYQPLKTNVTQGKADMHEGIDFYRHVEEDSTLPLHGCNQWPDDKDVPHFKRKFEDWQNRMLVIGEKMVLATAVGLGMDQFEIEELLALVKESFWVMRAIGYPPLPDTHDGISCGAHKDYGCYTLLHCTSQPGALQVYSSSSKTWIDANPIPQAFVVNIGEMWEIWTNGLYKSTLHRVIHKGDSYRISVPFFFEPNWDAEIRPLDAALRLQQESGETQPLKQSVVYGEFLTKKVAGNFIKVERY